MTQPIPEFTQLVDFPAALNSIRYFHYFDNDHLELLSPIVVGSTGFSLSFFIRTLLTNASLISGSQQSENGIYMDIHNGSLRAFSYTGTSLSTVLSSSVPVNDGRLNKIGLEVTESGNVTLLVNENPIATSSWDLLGTEEIAAFLKRPNKFGFTGLFSSPYFTSASETLSDDISTESINPALYNVIGNPTANQYHFHDSDWRLGLPPIEPNIINVSGVVHAHTKVDGMLHQCIVKNVSVRKAYD